jgi:hypothetical protein
VQQVVAIALPCCDEHEDVKGSEARGRNRLGLVCGFRQAASSCFRILFCRVCPSEVLKRERLK